MSKPNDKLCLACRLALCCVTSPRNSIVTVKPPDGFSFWKCGKRTGQDERGVKVEIAAPAARTHLDALSESLRQFVSRPPFCF